MLKIIFALIVLLISAVHPANASAPKLYFYPAPYKLSDGSMMPSILAVSAEHLTTLFPEIKEMDGVVLMVSWAQLCPSLDHCDFSMIDQVLDYWHAKGKKVILNLSTMGPPVKVIENGTARFENETPDWVLKDINTYPAHTGTIGVIHGMEVIKGVSHIDTIFPSVFDPRFVSYITGIVQALGKKYDGNPTLSYVRISIGKVGEDHPLPPEGEGLLAYKKIPGFTVMNWINYCKNITEIYQNAFHKSQLEFDIGFLPAAYAKISNPGERAATDQFMQYLNDSHIFIAFNGLESDEIDYWNAAGASDPRVSGSIEALHFLLQAKSQGNHIGLEEHGPMTNPKMQDIPSLAKVINNVGPDRLVLFGLDAGVINYAREGSNPANAMTVRYMSKQNKTIEEIGKLDQELLKLSGY